MKTLLSVFLFFSFLTSNAQSAEEKINHLLDNWHQAAAVADETAFYDSMTPDARYLGTDENEDWERDQMRKWSKEYFDQGTTWNFKKKNRNIYLYSDGKLAWFDETLDTWMGVCRGSGVVILTPQGWKIQHYVLSVAVPNDKIDAYLEIIK